jgi:hypothetical protein
VKHLHRRLLMLEENPDDKFYLDYITMRSGFIYRNADVLAHDEESITIRTPKDDPRTETVLASSDISSVKIIRD